MPRGFSLAQTPQESCERPHLAVVGFHEGAVDFCKNQQLLEKARRKNKNNSESLPLPSGMSRTSIISYDFDIFLSDSAFPSHSWVRPACLVRSTSCTQTRGPLPIGHGWLEIARLALFSPTGPHQVQCGPVPCFLLIQKVVTTELAFFSRLCQSIGCPSPRSHLSLLGHFPPARLRRFKQMWCLINLRCFDWFFDFFS